jgi:ABC-type transporter Mla subunit MlaD
MAKIYVCDNCGNQLGEEACSNSKEGVYCSAMCADEAETPQDLICILANLVRRVASLEQQLSAIQRNLETFAEQTENNSEDIRTLDERTSEFTTSSKSGAKLLAEAFDALSRYERSVR